ncbi:KIF20B isoform X2 [Octopus vulgaris]|nr:KIF20B isoform X2 [Octopus vulgaris]
MTSRETILSSGDAEDEDKDKVDGLRKNLLDEFYSETNDNFEKLKVYLRVRPFTPEEQQNKYRSCLTICGKTVTAWAPKDSNTYKSNTYTTNKNVQTFKFSRIFDEQTSQSDFYSETCQGLVKNFLNGQNCLMFAYGVTNSGKTYTIQGTPKEPGILPRTLETIFSHISGKLWHGLDLKPKMYLDVIKLSPTFEADEKQRKEELLRLASFDESDNQSTFADSGRESCTLDAQETTHDSDVNEEDLLRSTHLDDSAFSGQIKYSVWISFAEVYNENVFDLLVTPLHKKRNPLKLGQDKNSNHYIRGLTEVNVSSIEEAQKVLILGQKNLHKAATKLNHNSSRSHCIFNIKLVQVVNRKNPSVAKVSMLSLCDLAGSERTCKTNSTGDRLKEAGNINTSLLTLGRCIETMRSNQLRKEFPKLIPYRDSKLTRLFQGFFNGHGEAIMIVNVNKCSTLFDETLQVFKFSAIAKQVVIQKDPLKSPSVNISPVLPVKPLSNLERDSIPWATDVIFNEPHPSDVEPHPSDVEDETFEEEELTERESGLLNIIETCKTKISWLQKLLTEEKKNRMLDEIKIREEVTKEVMKQFVIIEKSYNEKLRASQLEAEERSNRCVLKMLNTVSSKKRSHDEVESEEKVVPLHVFEELQEKKQECELKIEKLNQQLESTKAQLRRLTLDRSALQSEKTSLQLQLEVPGLYKNPVDNTSMGDNIEQANVLNKLTSMLRDTQEKLGNKESAVNELEEQLEEAGETFKEQQEKIEQLEKMVKEMKKTSTECKVCLERSEAGSPVGSKAKLQKMESVPEKASEGTQPVENVAEFELRERALIHGYNAEIAKYKLLVRKLRQELGFRNTSHLSPNKSLRPELSSCLEHNELKQYLLRQVKKLQDELDKNSQCVSELLHELEVKKAAETDLEERLEKEAKGHQQAKAAVSEMREKLKKVNERCRSSSFEAEKTYLTINSEMFDSGDCVLSCKENKDEEFALGVKKSDENQSEHSDGNKEARDKIVKTKKEGPLLSIENQNDTKLSVFDNHNLKDKIINKNKEILKLQETLLSYSELDSKYQKKIKENEELLCEVQKHGTLERDLKKKVKNLEAKVEKIVVFEVEIESQVAIIKHLQSAVDEKSKLLSDLQSQNGGESPMLKRKMEEMQTVMEGLREMVDDSTKELAKNNEKIGDLENKEKMVSSLQTELETLKSCQSSLKSEAKIKSDSLQSKLDELQSEKDKVCKEKNCLENEVIQLKELVEKKTEEMSSLRTELKAKDIESEKENVLVINNLKNTLHNAVSEREGVVQELAEAKEKLLGKDEEICQMSKKIEEYEKKLEDSKTELEAVQEKKSIESDALNDIINEMNNKIASMNLLKEKLQKEIVNVAEHLKSLKTELATVRQLKLDMDDNVKSYMADLKSNLSEITGLTAAAAHCDKSMLTDLEMLPEKKEIESLNLKIVDLEKDLEDNVHVRENFMIEISCLVASLKNKDQQIENLTKDKIQASEEESSENKVNLLESDVGSEHTRNRLSSEKSDDLSSSSSSSSSGEKQHHQVSPPKQDNQSPPPKKPARQSAPTKPRRQSLCKKQDGDTQTSPEKQDRVKQTTPEMQVGSTQTSPEKQERLSNVTKKAKQEENEETMQMDETNSENFGDKHHVNLMKQELGSMASKLESLQKFYDDEKSLNDEVKSELNDVKVKLSEVKASYEAEKSVTHRLRYDLNDVRSSLNEVLESYEQLNLSRSVVLGDDQPEVNEQTIKSLLNELTLPQQDIINTLQKQGQSWKRKYEETSLELVSERQKLQEDFYTKAENKKLRKELMSTEKQLKDVQSQHEIHLITMETERMTKELIEERKRSEDRHLQEDMSRLRHQLQLAKENSEKYSKLKIEVELLRDENNNLKKKKSDVPVDDKSDDKVDKDKDKRDCKSSKEDMDLGDMSTAKGKEDSEETSKATVATQTDLDNKETCDACELVRTEKQQLAEKLKVSQKKILAFEEDVDVAETPPFSRVGSSRQLRREKILAETAKMEAEFALKVAQEKILTLTKDLEKLQETKCQELSQKEVWSVPSKSCSCQTNDISLIEDKNEEFKKLKDDLEMERRRIVTSQQDLQQKSSIIETLKMSLKDQDDTIVELEDIMKRKESKINALEEELLQKDEKDRKRVAATSDKCEQCRLSLVEGSAPETMESSNGSEGTSKDSNLQTVVSHQTKTIQTLSHEKSQTELTCKNMNLEMQHMKMALAVMECERDSLRKRLEMVSGKSVQSPTTNTQGAATKSHQSPMVSAHSAAGKSFQSPVMKSSITSAKSQPSPSRLMPPPPSSSSSSSERKDNGNGAAQNTKSVEETTPGKGIMLRNVEQWRKQKALVVSSIKKANIEKIATTLSNSQAPKTSHSVHKHNSPAPNSAVPSRLCNNVTSSLHRSPSTCRTQRLCNMKQNTNTGTSSPVPSKKQVIVPSEPSKTPQVEGPPESAESPPMSPGIPTDRKNYREIDVTPPVAIRALRRNRKRKPLETSPQKNLLNSSKYSLSSKALNLCHKANVSDEQPNSSAQGEEGEAVRQLPPRRSKSVAIKKIQSQNSFLKNSPVSIDSPVSKNSPVLKKKKESDSEDISLETGTPQGSPQKSTMDRIRNLKNSFRSSSFRKARNLLKPNSNVSSPVYDSPRNQSVKPSVASTTKPSKTAITSDTESSNNKNLQNILTSTTTRSRRRLYKDQIVGPMDFVNVTATTTLKPKDDVFNSLMHQLRNRRRETQYKS